MCLVYPRERPARLLICIHTRNNPGNFIDPSGLCSPNCPTPIPPHPPESTPITPTPNPPWTETPSPNIPPIQILEPGPTPSSTPIPPNYTATPPTPSSLICRVPTPPGTGPQSNPVVEPFISSGWAEGYVIQGGVFKGDINAFEMVYNFATFESAKFRVEGNSYGLLGEVGVGVYYASMYGFNENKTFDEQYSGVFVALSAGGSVPVLGPVGLGANVAAFSSVFKGTNIPNFEVVGTAKGVGGGLGIPVSAIASRTVYGMEGYPALKPYKRPDDTVRKRELANDILIGRGLFDYAAAGYAGLANPQPRISAASQALFQATRYELFYSGRFDPGEN